METYQTLAEIITVRRLTDNVTFTIGTKTDEGTIKGFHIEDDMIWVRTVEKGGLVSLSEIEKITTNG